jgi:phospholipid transport system transporter-binding protein
MADDRILSVDALTFATARTALAEGCAAIDAGKTVFDLSGVNSADSSGVALMLAWQRRARQLGREVVYANVPHNLDTLARLYGVDSLLPQS